MSCYEIPKIKIEIFIVKQMNEKGRKKKTVNLLKTALPNMTIKSANKGFVERKENNSNTGI